MNRIVSPFLLGFLSISLQILLLREFCAQFYGNEVVLGFVLGAWLLWGSLGSLLAGRFHLQPSALSWLFQASLVLAVIVFSCLRFSRFLWKASFGESLGMMPAFITALGLCALLSLPFGLLFFLNVKVFGGNIAHVYMWESLGAGIAGLAVDLLLIPHVTSWQAIGLLGLFSLALLILSSPQKSTLGSSAFILILLALFSPFDFASQKKILQPFPLIRSHDSRYGRLQIVRIGEQITLYQDGLSVVSCPDPTAAEETIHFALLQRPRAKSLLLISGGVGGALREALKYPEIKVDYVEIDPEIIRLMKPFLPPEDRLALASSRVTIHHLDGRAFLQKTDNIYDVIIVAVPEPATAQLNRFYTREFFTLAKEHLSSDGVISLRVSSAENYQNPALRRFLTTIHETLSAVFPQVRIIPGDTNIFLASTGKIEISLDYFAATTEELHIQTQTIRPQVLFARLNPLRLASLREKIMAFPGGVNEDLLPRGYFHFASFWATQFGSRETQVLEFFSHLSPFLVGLSPILLVFFLFSPLLLFRGPSSLPGLPLIVLGFTTMMAETLILLWFQTAFGYIYEKIALLLASFMFGLFAGALLGKKLKKGAGMPPILIDQMGLIFLLALLWFLLHRPVPVIIPYFLLFFLGFVGGHLFIVSNIPLLRLGPHYGLGYGLDLAGSFLGAVLGPSLFFPLLGLPRSIISLILLNFLSLLACIPLIGKRKQ